MGGLRPDPPDEDRGEQVNRLVDAQIASARAMEDERPDLPGRAPGDGQPDRPERATGNDRPDHQSGDTSDD